jgi:UDP-glucose 4-epimerase
MKILVTGGAGFIGSHIVETLANDGATVVVYDNLSTGLTGNISGLKNVSLVQGDILDRQSLQKAMTGVDAVSHQAAQLEITTSIADPLSDLRSNTEGALNVLRAMTETGVSRLMFASSACVYGEAEYIPEDELHPTNPNWEYGVSKLASEKYCRIYSQAHGIRFTAFRYSIVYGPREWYGRVLTIFLRRLIEKMSPVVFGEGDQLRDFVYVRDVVALHNACLNNPAAEGQIFNASTGLGTSIRDLAHLVCRSTGTATAVEHEAVRVGERSKLVDGRQRLPAELQRMVLNPQKAERLIGWKAAVPLPEGIKHEWEWLKKNSGLWQEMHY